MYHITGTVKDVSKLNVHVKECLRGCPALALVTMGTAKIWHYIVVYGNIEVHGDNGKRLGRVHILNRSAEKKPMIPIGRPAVQNYGNKIPAAMNLLGIELAHLDKVPVSFKWTEIYTSKGSKVSPASSLALINGSTDILTIIDDRRLKTEG